MKIRVMYSDGVFRGGLLDLKTFNALTCRMWKGLTRKGVTEHLMDIARPEDRLAGEGWFALFIDEHSKPQGPRGEEFDPASHALKLTAAEALQWFVDHGYPPPADLRALTKAPIPAHVGEAGAAMPPPLSEALQEVWDALRGRALSGKQLATLLMDGPADADAIRKRIQDIRKTGRAISTRRLVGYHRPDAPPPEPEPIDDVTSP